MSNIKYKKETLELVKLEIENIEDILSDFDFNNFEQYKNKHIDEQANKQLNLALGCLTSYLYLLSEDIEEFNEINASINDLFLNGSDSFISDTIVSVLLVKNLIDKKGI